ncbi:BTB/POZ-like [Lasallia pustulata]|uniref:BTB/POZ-like n=1 Tax=Lasallia pustulata TaxID=136370 RepID=A0A1W5CWU7_9LECA|nr:BTB/POZ-like [Lasallia pustulata]
MPGVEPSGFNPKPAPTVSTPSSPTTTSPLIPPDPTVPVRQLFKTIVHVTVGPSKIVFPVHRELLCAASTFFTAALNPRHGFLESVTSTVHLPEARPAIFEYFVQWLYTRSLGHEDLDGQEQPAYFRLIGLYALADMLGVEGCKNDVCDKVGRLAEERNCVVNPDDTRMLWGEVREGAGLRVLVLDLFAFKKTGRLVETHEDSWDERFLRDLVARLKTTKGWEGGSRFAPWRSPAAMCEKYHEHADGVAQFGGDYRCTTKTAE